MNADHSDTTKRTLRVSRHGMTAAGLAKRFEVSVEQIEESLIRLLRNGLVVEDVTDG